MSEFKPFDLGDYISSTGEIIVEISTFVLDALQASDVKSIALDLDQNIIIDSSGIPTSEDFLQVNPELSVETAEELERIREASAQAAAWSGARDVTASLHLHEVADEAKNLNELGLNDDERKSILESMELTQPRFALWQSGDFIHKDDGKEIEFSCTSIYADREGDELASMITIRISDGDLWEMISFTLIGNKPAFAFNHLEPEEDNLMTRASTLLNLEDFSKAQLIAGGLIRDEEEAAQLLGDIWLSYQGTSKEIEVGPLLDEISERAVAIRDARELNKTLPNHSIPSFQELLELKNYLS